MDEELELQGSKPLDKPSDVTYISGTAEERYMRDLKKREQYQRQDGPGAMRWFLLLILLCGCASAYVYRHDIAAYFFPEPEPVQIVRAEPEVKAEKPIAPPPEEPAAPVQEVAAAPVDDKKALRQQYARLKERCREKWATIQRGIRDVDKELNEMDARAYNYRALTGQQVAASGTRFVNGLGYQADGEIQKFNQADGRRVKAVEALYRRLSETGAQVSVEQWAYANSWPQVDETRIAFKKILEEVQKQGIYAELEALRKKVEAP